MKNEEILEYLKKNIKKKRYHHILRVADTAEKLAIVHDIPADKVYTAALLHDCAKGNEESLLKDYKNIIVNEWVSLEEELKEKSLIHGPLAGIIARDVFGIEEKDILNAVIYHTTGRENMTKLEKIVFLADKLEPKRDYPGVDKIRETAQIDLEKAVLLTIDNTVKYLIENQELIAVITVKTRNNILRR